MTTEMINMRTSSHNEESETEYSYDTENSYDESDPADGYEYAYLVNYGDDRRPLEPTQPIGCIQWDIALIIMDSLGDSSYQMFRLTCTDTYRCLARCNDAVYTTIDAALNGYTNVFECLLGYGPDLDKLACDVDNHDYLKALQYGDYPVNSNTPPANYVVVYSSAETVRSWADRGWLSENAAKIAYNYDNYDNFVAILDSGIAQNYKDLVKVVCQDRALAFIRLLDQHHSVPVDLRPTSMLANPGTACPWYKSAVDEDDLEFVRWMMVGKAALMSDVVMYTAAIGTLSMLKLVCAHTAVDYEDLYIHAVSENDVGILDWIHPNKYCVKNDVYTSAVNFDHTAVCKWALDAGIEVPTWIRDDELSEEMSDLFESYGY